MGSTPNRESLFIFDLDSTFLGKGGSLFSDSEGNIDTTAVEFIKSAKLSNSKLVFLSSRNRLQLTEITRLIGDCDFIGELGFCIGLNSGREIVETASLTPEENPFDLYNQGKLNFILADFSEVLELHEPWYLNSRISLMLRGCLMHNDNFLVQEINEKLVESSLSFLRTVENGTTKRFSGTCKKNAQRIYHIINKKISKLNGLLQYLNDYLKDDTEDRMIIAAGDSALDLEIIDLVDIFYFVGDKESFNTAKLILHIQEPEIAAALENSEHKIKVQSREKMFEEITGSLKDSNKA